jgi:PAT family beta-lactamase induction signal transducer AmpG
VERQAALAATYQTGYRLAMIWAGAGVLWIAARAEVADVSRLPARRLANRLPGHGGIHAAGRADRAVFPGTRAPRIAPAKNAADWLKGALVEPFADFIRRYRWQAALILALIAIYRISDVVMGIMANPFYVDHGLHQGRGRAGDQGLRRRS